MTLTSFDFWRDRLRASAIHLGISLSIAALAALLVFGIWYPYPYREISGGRELFLIVVTVDVILGPLITLAVFNRKKPWTELRRDLAFVGLIQLSALAYGLWTVSVARPVHLVFEIDRFRVVHAIEVEPELLNRAPKGINAMPWTGPSLLSVRAFKDRNESFEATMAALQGVTIGARPDLWQSYAAGVPDVLKVAKPVANLKTRFPQQAADIDQVLQKASKSPQTLLYVPMVGRKSFWTVFVDPTTADVLATMPLDSF
ncbi:MAG: pilus assembly protein [Burkholderiales bacterium PBB3]|nr:MAG: pilus assembly protein [Burkholderiales bacterium PBB3]